MEFQESKRDKLNRLKAQLDNERQSFMGHWKELGDYILPRRPRFFTSDVNRGERKNKNIINSTASRAARTLRSGMMAGITSPARPWFRLSTPDPDLADFGAVKNWLHTVTQRMESVFLRSNIYNSLPIVYGDLGTFATSSMMIEEDEEDVVRSHVFPIGSYYIACDQSGRVNTFYRTFKMTVQQLISKFGFDDTPGQINWDRFSSFVKSEYSAGRPETWIEVDHVIMPNEKHNPFKIESKFKRFSSCYFETGNRGKDKGGYQNELDKDRYLRESGYDIFPVLSPRWEVTGEDVYGSECPGMLALGDIKALQLMEKRKAQAVEKGINPPMVAPTEMKNIRASILPGDTTYVNEREGSKGFRPAHEVNLRINDVLMDIERHEERIRSAFYEDLFLMLANSDRREITAREIDARQEEKLLALGPVLEQLNQDQNDPMIDIVFDIMNKRGMIPTPPEEIQGVKLKVQYISIMAQAQKLVGISSHERFATAMGTLVSTTQNPEVLDKFNVNKWVDGYGDLLSMPPGVIRSDDELEELQVKRAKAQQAAVASEKAMQAASAAKTLSETDINKDSALKAILQQARAGQPVATQP